MKTLWVVGGGEEAVPGIRHAKALGYRVVVSDGSRAAPGFQVADDYHVVSTYDPDGTAASALLYAHVNGKIDGVIALVADVPLTVATVAEKCGVHGLPIPVARLGTDKLKMKWWLQGAGIRTTRGSEVSSAEHMRRIIYHGESSTPRPPSPLIIKPVDSRGARGVIRILDDTDPSWAYAQAKSQSTCGRVMAEEWLAGPQISTETVILSDGSISTPGFLDRNYSRLDEFAPYVIEDGADAPTRLTPEEKRAVIDCVEEAAKLISGGVACTVKGDVVLADSSQVGGGGGVYREGGPLSGYYRAPVIIELALRLSGGYMSSDIVPINTGVDLVGAAIKIACGDPVTLDDVTPKHDTPVAIRYRIPPGCTNHTGRRGHVIAAGGVPGEAVHAAEQAVRDGVLGLVQLP